MDKPNCYECIHRCTIPGDCHSRCGHPLVGKEDLTAALLAILGSRFPNTITEANTTLKIKGNAHGIRSGWFYWPFNFDPVWLENCEGFEPKNKVDTSS
jgi:hypothetical protein